MTPSQEADLASIVIAATVAIHYSKKALGSGFRRDAVWGTFVCRGDEIHL